MQKGRKGGQVVNAYIYLYICVYQKKEGSKVNKNNRKERYGEEIERKDTETILEGGVRREIGRKDTERK